MITFHRVLVFWAGCGLISHGLWFPTLEGGLGTYWGNFLTSLVFSLILGPIGLLVSLLTPHLGERGWRLW